MGIVFRSNTNFHGHVWRDWAVFDWGEEGHVPCHIMGFVDLRVLPAGFEHTMGGLEHIAPGTYAIVQCAECASDEERLSDITMSKSLKTIITGYTNGRVSHMTLWLAPVQLGSIV